MQPAIRVIFIIRHAPRNTCAAAAPRAPAGRAGRARAGPRGCRTARERARARGTATASNEDTGGATLARQPEKVLPVSRRGARVADARRAHAVASTGRSRYKTRGDDADADRLDAPRLRVHLWAVAVPGPVASQEEVKSRPPFPTARQRLPFSCAVQRPSAVSLPQSSRAPCRAPQTVRRC